MSLQDDTLEINRLMVGSNAVTKMWANSLVVMRDYLMGCDKPLTEWTLDEIADAAKKGERNGKNE